jgi:16S rRNA (adenine1518-N6/adenine1519-N6)-dimethyltransferase
VDRRIDLPPLNVTGLLRAFHLRPKKGLGQNFLVDPVALGRVVEAAGIGPQETVLEVGPGLGSLTRFLAQAARRVVAVELDAEMFPVLQHVLQGMDNVTLVQGDILELDPAGLGLEAGYVAAANIPYYITSALIRHLLEAPVKPARLALTVQKEVAARLCATPDDMNLLALSVQVYGAPRTVASIPSEAFYPQPEIDSSIVRVDLFPEPVIPAAKLDTFFRLARGAFGQKRKMLRNSLSSSLNRPAAEVSTLLESAGIDPMRRAETLYLAEWRALVEIVSKPNHE